MDITSGDYKVLESGTVISFEQEPVTFQLAADLKVRLAFHEEKENKDVHRLEFKSISKNELDIILVNFNNPLGTGNTSPLQVGTLNNKKLYLNFRVHTLNEITNKTIHYCWYLGEEVNNG